MKLQLTDTIVLEVNIQLHYNQSCNLGHVRSSRKNHNCYQKHHKHQKNHANLHYVWIFFSSTYFFVL